MRVVTFAVFSRPGEIGSRESWNEQTNEGTRKRATREIYRYRRIDSREIKKKKMLVKGRKGLVREFVRYNFDKPCPDLRSRSIINYRNMHIARKSE